MFSKLQQWYYQYAHYRKHTVNRSKTPQISVVRTPEVTKETDSWPVDWDRAAVRAVVAGTLVPVVTTPMVIFETHFARTKSYELALKATLENPWKGYGVYALTNTARLSLLFNMTPLAKSYFIGHNFEPLPAKIMAYGVAGVTEGVIMSPRTPFMQMLHTLKVKSPTVLFKQILANKAHHVDGIKQIPPGDLMVIKWKIGFKHGIGRDGAAWSIYAATVDGLEKKYKPKGSLSDWRLDFSIGVVGGLAASPVTYPMHAMMRRRMDNPIMVRSDLKAEWKVMTAPGDLKAEWKVMSAFDDLKIGWKAFGEGKEHGGCRVMYRHLFKGYPMCLVILPSMMGAVNASKHLADRIYTAYCNKTGFFKPKPLPAVTPPPQPQNANQFSLGMGPP
jgi:hypothetical protein